MVSSSRFQKRCYYEVLCISKESSPQEIRSSYQRLVSQRDPNKLIKSGGLSEAEATAKFQELVNAYDVLSDPEERAWYNSHRSQILFSDNGRSAGSVPAGSVPNLFAFFYTTVYSGLTDTRRGFYNVYFNVFNNVYLNEVKFARTLGLRLDSVREAPILGNLETPYPQVMAFYDYWLGFCTVMDFCWVKNVRKKAETEYNETVRCLAEFVKKRDKRVIEMLVKENAEMEKKEEERESKKKMVKDILERAMNYEEPDCAKSQDGEGGDDDATRKKEELYCIVCSKKFKTEKQWKNHKQSKKHKENVAELRASFRDIEDEKDEEEISNPLEPPESVEKLHEKFQEGLNIDDEEENEEEVVGGSDETDEEYFVAEEDVNGSSESEDVDDENSILKKMVSEQKNKRKNIVSRKEDEIQVDISKFDNQTSTCRNRKAKERKDMKDDVSKVQTPGENSSTDENMNATDTASGAVEDSQNDEAGAMEYDNRKSIGRRRRSKKNLSGLMEKNNKADDTQDRKADMEESDSDTSEEHSKSARSKKTKGRSKKTSSNECDRCGKEFESRTKLHKHLTEYGHATLKKSQVLVFRRG